MNLKLLMAATLFATAPVVAFAQREGATASAKADFGRCAKGRAADQQ